MAVTSAQVTVGTSATALSAAETDSRSGEQLRLLNSDATNAVFIGPAGVTTATGYKLLAGATIGAIELDAGETLYGVVAAGTVVVHVLRLGN